MRGVVAGKGSAGGGPKASVVRTGIKGAGNEESGFLVAYCGWADYHLGFRRRYGHQGAAGTAATAAIAMGHRDNRGVDERLQFPRHHAVGDTALDPGRLRAALQCQSSSGNTMSAFRVRASTSRTAPRPKSTSTAASGRPSTSSRSISALVLLVSGWPVLQSRPFAARCTPDWRLRTQTSAERQRRQRQR